jgi:group I intron endonuclease
MENLLKNSKSHICSALLKNGYPNFSLEIIEYCKVSELIIREKYYIDFLQSEYNIIKDPTLPPMSNRTHSDETRKIMSEAKIGSKHSDKTRQIMSEAKKGKNHPEETKKKISDSKLGQPRPVGAGKACQSIEVSDLKESTTTSYNSINEAARALNINNAIIVKYFANNQQKPYKGLYVFKKVEG